MDTHKALSERGASRLIVVGVIVLVFLLTLLGISTQTETPAVDVGVRCVKLLYEFDLPEDILDNQQLLMSVLTEEEFERLTVDNTNRAINAYYKFQYSPSHVVVDEYGPGYVRYRLENEYIDSDEVWVFLYELTEDGRITNVREYSTLNWKEREMDAVS